MQAQQVLYYERYDYIRYTSKASFFDKDIIPVYNNNPQEYVFSGKRIHRGLYQTASGKLINADVNGALNILVKSSVVSIKTLYSRGEVDTPVRIRLSQQTSNKTPMFQHREQFIKYYM